MGKLEQYAQKNTKIEREPVYDQEKSHILQQNDFVQPLSGNELVDKYQKRIQGDTTFEDRTRYYFEDYHLLDAKVKRYRNMANDDQRLGEYSNTFDHYKANKRKGFANAAADNFEAASKLALSLDENKTKGFALYQHREKIMRLRMSGMENAAKAKSVSDDDEAYRILKGKLSCLSILKDQLEVMGQDESLSPQEAAKFAEAKARIDSELEGVKNKLMSREKIHVKTWERENGINDDSIKTKLRTEKRTHPHVNAEALKIVGTMNTLMAEGKRPEYSAAYNNMEKKHSAFRNIEQYGGGAHSRILLQPCRAVMRDRNGLPVSDTERRKEEWNKKWLNAVGSDDSETINSMLKESYERFEKMEFPTPEELRTKGIMYFYKKDPVAFYEMMRFSGTVGNMVEANDFAKEYYDSHETFRKKVKLAAIMSTMFTIELNKSKYMIDATTKDSEYLIMDIKTEAQYNSLKRDDADHTAAIQDNLDQYAQNHQEIQDAYKAVKTRDMKKAEEHTDTVTDMKGELKQTINELKKAKARSGKTISAELEELDKAIALLDNGMRKQIPLAETANREEGFDYTILMIEALYNRISRNVDKCLSKSSNYKGLKHGKLMLEKLKRQCAAEIGAFRGAAIEYRRAIQEGSIGPFGKGHEPTWRDALNYTRSVIYDLDKKGEGELMHKEDSGNNTNVIFIENITARKVKSAKEVQKELHGRQKQKIKVVFRDDDTQRSDTIDEMIGAVINGVKFDIEDKALEVRLRKDLIKAAQKDRKANGYDDFKENIEAVKDSETAFAARMIKDKNIKAGAKGKKGDTGELSIFRNLYNLFYKQEYRAYAGEISHAMKELGRAIFHRSMAEGNARIKDGRNISNRNIATSRMATLLGIENLVCDSRSAYIRRKGKLRKGVVMENSGGKDGGELINKAREENKKIKYSDEAINQLFTIQMFDTLCGQIDRNHRNFHFEHKVEGDTYILTNVKCIDNDMSFGNKTDITEDFNQLRAVSERNLKALPIEMLNRFMGLMPVNFESILGDLLEKDEIEALTERLNIIKDAVRDMEKKGILEMYRGQYRYANEDMRDDKLRQLQVLKELSDEARKNFEGQIEDRFGFINDDMHKLSVFHESIIGGEKDVDEGEVLDRMIKERKEELALIKSGKKIEKKKAPKLDEIDTSTKPVVIKQDNSKKEDKKKGDKKKAPRLDEIDTSSKPSIIKQDSIKKEDKKKEEKKSGKKEKGNKTRKDSLSEFEIEQIKQIEKMQKKQVLQEQQEQVRLENLYRKSKGTQIKLNSRYDYQGTNNCFACSGTALLNHFIAKNRKLKPGEKARQYNQYDMRNINPDEYVKSYEESRNQFISRSGYNNAVSNMKSRVGNGTSGFMDIFEMGDFFFREEKDLMIHQQKIEVAYDNKTMYEAQKSDFVKQVKAVLDSGDPVAMFEQNHYVTITGIKGNIVEYMDSRDDTKVEGTEVTKPKYATVDELFSRKRAGATIGITWLSKLEDPKDIVKKFKYVSHNGKEFYSTDKGGGTFDLLHKHGVAGMKQLKNGITYDIYVPKNMTPISKTGSGMNIIIEEEEDEKEEIIEKHNIIEESSEIKKTKTKKTETISENDVEVKIENKSYEELKKLDPAVTKKGFIAIKEYRKFSDYLYNNRELQAEFRKAAKNTPEWCHSLDRDAGYVMRFVNLDKDGKPATKEDMANHEWNIKWLKAWQKNDPKSLQTREDMVAEQMGHVMDGFPFPKEPTQKMLKDSKAFTKHIESWIENTLLKEGNFQYIAFLNSCPLAYDTLKDIMPGLKEYAKNNEALILKDDIATALFSYAKAYLVKKYHIDLDKGVIVRFSKDKNGGFKGANEMFRQTYISTLMSYYNTYLGLDRKKAEVPYKKAPITVQDDKKKTTPQKGKK